MNKVQQLIDNLTIPAAVTTFDCEYPVIVAANKPHEKLTGWATSEAAGENPRIFKGPLTEGMRSKEIKESLRVYDCWVGEVVNYRKDKTPYRVNITILPIVVDTQRYYIALKRAVGLFS